MPIVDVEIVDGTPAPGLAQQIADDVGEVFGAAAGKVGVRLRTLDAGSYAENRAAAPRPVFVRVRASAPPEGEMRQRVLSGITAAVARRTGRPPENVHVLFEPAAKGRIAFGGRPVE